MTTTARPSWVDAALIVAFIAMAAFCWASALHVTAVIAAGGAIGMTVDVVVRFRKTRTSQTP